MKTSFPKRLLAFLLVLCMVIPMLPAITLPTKAATNAEAIQASQDPVIVIAGSDFQNSGIPATDTSLVTGMLNQIKAAGYNTADGFLFAGDYETSALPGSVATIKTNKEALKSAVDAAYPAMDDANMIFVQGNHDPDASVTGGDLAPTGANDPASGAYGVYALNEMAYFWHEYGTEADVIAAAATLRSYLNEKLAQSFSKPIFVVSHLPLHYTMRTSTQGDGKYANYIFDVLNNAGAAGLNIIFLYGHHHSNSWLDSQGGAAVYFAKGDKVNIAQASRTVYKEETLNFTYMNAGFVGYYSTTNSTAGVEKDLTMSVFEISGNEVKISRYSADGLHDLKSAGVPNTAYSEPFEVNTKVYGSPQIVKLNTIASNANGITVSSDGVTGVTATTVVGDTPYGYSAYRTYDIDPIGYIEGNPATVSIPVDATFDATRPALVIDHTNGYVWTCPIVNDRVTFETSHFSDYTVAQAVVEPVTATGILTDYTGIQVTELIAGSYYKLRNIQNNRMLTGNVITSDANPTRALEMVDGVIANGDLWYYDGTHLRLGDDDFGYLMLSNGMAYLDTLDATINPSPDRRMANLFRNDDGTTFTLKRDPYYCLNAYGGSTATIAAGYNADGNKNPGSKWAFYTMEDAEASLTVTPSATVLTLAQTATMLPTVIINGVEELDYTLEWASSDSSVAVVDENGFVQALSPGRVAITATLTSVQGFTLSEPITAKVLVSVYSVNEGSTVAKSSATMPTMERVTDLVAGVPSGPYVIETNVANTAYLYLSGNVATSSRNVTGLELVTTNDFTELWYYDGTYLRYGAPDGPYLAYENNTIKLSTSSANAFDTVTANGTLYNIANSKISGNNCVNQSGGANYNTVALYSAAHSYWIFNKVNPNAQVSLTVNPGMCTLTAGEEAKLLATILLDGKLTTDYTLSWSVADSSVATVSNGTVTGVAAGKTTVTCTLTSVCDSANQVPLYVNIPIEVTAEEKTETGVIANGYTAPYAEKVTNLTKGTASGPYIIYHRQTNWVLSGTVLYKDSEGYHGYSNREGLALLETVDLENNPPLWYYDGNALKFGSSAGLNNYMVYDADANMVKLGSSDEGGLFDMIGRLDSATSYWIGTSSIADSTEGELYTRRYLNQLGGTQYNIVAPYDFMYTSSGTTYERQGSKWYFYQYVQEKPVTLTVTPDEAVVNVGQTVTLPATVTVDGQYATQYTINWASSDTSVATVANGVVTAKAAGRTVVTATLTQADGYDTEISVEIPITVISVTKDSQNRVNVSTELGPRHVSVTSLPEGISGPYLVCNHASGYILTGTEGVRSPATVGLWLKPPAVGDYSDLWYYDGTHLIYGDPNATDRYLVFENDMVSLGSDTSVAFDSVISEGDGKFSITADHIGGKYLNQYGSDKNEAAGLYSMSGGTNSGSAWDFHALVPESSVQLIAYPEDYSDDLLITDTKKLATQLIVDGVNTSKYTVSYTVSDPSVVTVGKDGTVHPQKSGTVTINVKLVTMEGEEVATGLIAPITLRVCGVQSATINTKEGALPINASDRLRVSAASENAEAPVLTVTYENGVQKQVPLTSAYLTDANGNKVSTAEANTLENLTVTYEGAVACNDFTLHVLKSDLPDYPDYPAEGSVFVDKTAMDTQNFQASGLAQVELSTSGIPVKKGADVIIMLDTSSSMSGIVEGAGDERLNVLCASLNDLLNGFQEKAADGTTMDVRVAVADFNGFYYDEYSPYYINPADTMSNSSVRTGTNSRAVVYTGDRTLSTGAFIQATDLGLNAFTTNRSYQGPTAGKYTLTMASGTNYDYALDAVYQMGQAINDANAAAGEDRDLFVIFMSDGAPFQYNYFGSHSTTDYWSKYLMGQMEDSMFASGADKSFYHPDGKHWMAEAIKGDRSEDYPVIRKNDPHDTNDDNWIDVQGLGATMYSIGFCLAVDGKISVESMEYVIKQIASEEKLAFFANTASQLDTAFSSISNDIMYAASGAYFVDTMGAQYDLKLGNHSYTLNNVAQTFTDNRIEVRSYSIYTMADLEKGLCTEDQLGVRKTDASGNPIYTVEETVTFNAAGTEAYSDKVSVIAADGTVTYPSILIDGVIMARSFRYNTTAATKNINLPNGEAYDLASETFYWSVGSISMDEKALNYYVYLTGASEGTRSAGIYPTNESATLYYENYLRNKCHLEAPIPTMPWNQAQVGYGFYLVDKDGKPIVNKSTGMTGSFEQSIKSVVLCDPVYREFNTNSSVSLSAGSLLPASIAKEYRLFDNAARYDVRLNSDGSGSIAVYTNGSVPLTTYIEGLTPKALLEGDELGSQKLTTNFANANTVVWFAVTVADGTLVVDKTVDAVEGKDDEFSLTLDAYSTGNVVELSTTKPSDIVLVLDQSASMYTPKGANADRYDRWYSQNANTLLTKISTDDLDKEKGAHLGYYVAQSKERNRVVNEGSNDYNGNGYTGEALNIYDWFIVQYVDGTGWVYVRVGDTTTPVAVDVTAKQAYDFDSGDQYNKTLVSNESSGRLITGFNYYQSQYGALYESVNEFVSDLVKAGAEAGVEHRVAITGFSSPYYDGIKNYDGTGLYIDGNYYLYDADHRYMGYRNTSSTYGYTLYVPAEDYESMKGILPANLKGNIWNDTLPAGAQLVPLNPNTAGDYFIPNATMTLPPMVTAEQYSKALMPVGTDAVSSGVIASIEAIRTNYLQTCPAAGLDMARKIFAADPSTDRDQVVILFTDGVPTVSLDANAEYGSTKNAGDAETYWSGMAGAKDAINLANEMKSQRIQIYTIGTSGLTANVPVHPSHKGDGAAVISIDGESFLNYVSSNYQGVTSTHTVQTKGYDTPSTADDNNELLVVSQLTLFKDGTEITASNPATPAASIYSKTSASGDFSIAFSEIMYEVSSPNVTLGEEAVLKEVISDYFDLSVVDPSEIQIYVAPYTGPNSAGWHTFGTPVLASTVGLNIEVSFEDLADRENVNVLVKGFDYSKHYVHQNLATGEYEGYKLIVKVPIKTREGFWGGNNVPTNDSDTAIYTGDGENVVTFPEPQANVPVKPVITGKDQVVYYGEDELDIHDDLVDTITVDGKEVTYNKETGKFTPVDDWMDDFADMIWNPEYPDTTVSGTESGEYTFGVVLMPKTDGTRNDNPDNPSNIAGNPVSTTEGIASDDASGSVDVLVPVITFEDSTIELGDVTDKDYYEDTNRKETIIWVNKDDPYGDKGLPTEPSEGFDTEPDLSFSYSIEGTGENYFKQDTPVNVEVHLGANATDDNKITDEVYFDWNHCDSKLHDEDETITDDQAGDSIHRHKGSTDSNEFNVHLTYILSEDTIVIDFGLSVNVDAMMNDTLPADAAMTAVNVADAIPGLFTQQLDGAYASSKRSDHGEMEVITIEKGKTVLRYTPSDMEMNGKEVFVYAVKNGDATRYYYSTVTVIPATVIYYEDSFIEYGTYTTNDDGSYTTTEGGWTEVGESVNGTQAEDHPGEALNCLDANNIYGYDDAYTNMTTYSNGSAMHITVDENVSGEAVFNFWGTGFDIISMTSADTGTILVEVLNLETNKTTYHMVDTYYGYRYNALEGAWEVDPDDSDALYQVPVMKVDTGKYGHYQVTIDVSYGDWLDHKETGSYDFYLDAIRIYNPAMVDQNGNIVDDVINDAYYADHEANPTYQELRDLIIGANDFDSLGSDEIKAGVVFIDGNTDLSENGSYGSVENKDKTYAISEYINYGPNNELYLAPGQAVTFNLDAVDLGGRVHLALKSVGTFGGKNDEIGDGNGSATVEIFGLDDKNNRTDMTVGTDGVISSATDLYYDITALAGKTVVIRNNGDAGIVSITNIKTTNSAQQQVLSISRGAVTRVLAFLNEGAPAPIEPTVGAISLSHATLSFEDEIKMNVYFNLKDMEPAELGLITFTAESAEGTIDNADAVISGGVLHENGFYSVSTEGIAAKNLGDKIYFRVYARLADGSYVYSKATGYSPVAYANTVLNGNYSAQMKTLVVAMLNYGAAAQTFFGYRTDALVNKDLTAEQRGQVCDYSADLMDKVVKPTAEQLGSFKATTGGFLSKYPTISFEGAFSINYYFTLDRAADAAPQLYYWTGEARENADVLTAENASGVLTMTEDGAWQAAVTGIAAKDLDDTIWVAAVYESEGVRYCSGILSYSIGAYCVSQAAATGSAMAPFAQAAAVYGSCAKAYFG